MNSFAAFLRGSQEISISVTTSLVYGGPYVNIVSATGAGLRVRLPSAITLRLGRAQRWIANNGANSFTVRDAGNNDLLVLAPGDCADFHLLSNATAAGVWKWEARTVGSAAAPGLALLGYLIGGVTGGGGATLAKKTNEWNPQAGIWSAKSDSPSSVALKDCSSFVIGAHGYLVEPNAGTTSGKYLEQYDPDVHTIKAVLPSTSGVGQGSSCTLNGFGCRQGGTGLVAQYDEGGDSWTAEAQRPSGQRSIGTGWLALASGVGTCFGTDGMTPSNRTDEYTQATDTWAQKTTRPGPSSLAFGNTILNGLGYTFGGTGSSAGTTIPDTYEYSALTLAWTKRIDWPGASPVSKPTAIPLVNRAYVMGGVIGSGITSAADYEYDPLAIVFTQKIDIVNSNAGLQNHGMAIAV